jgi:hypothetical protein
MEHGAPAAPRAIMSTDEATSLRFAELARYAWAMAKVAMQGLTMRLDSNVLYLKVADELPSVGARMRLKYSLSTYGGLLRAATVVSELVRPEASLHGVQGRPPVQADRISRVAMTFLLPMQVHLALFDFWAAYPHGLLIDSNAWTRLGGG